MSSVQYNHGVEISPWGELRGAADIRVGMKPTVIFERHIRQFTAKVLAKEKEMRFGAVYFDRYMNVLEETSKEGFTWYSDNCSDAAVYLCCYNCGARLYRGRTKVEGFQQVSLAVGDTVEASLDEASVLSFRVNGEVILRQHSMGAEASLALQFLAENDSVRLDFYQHGVEVQDRVVTALETAQSEQPTLVLSGPLALRVRRKTEKMMFGVVDLARYAQAIEAGHRGHAWYSQECRDGVAVYLCCYPTGAKIYNGNNRCAANNQFVLSEGDIVTVDRDVVEATRLIFRINGREIASVEARAAEECCLAIQLDAVGDSVELLSPTDAAAGAAAAPNGIAVKEVPAIYSVKVPKQIRTCFGGDGFVLRRVKRSEAVYELVERCFAVTRPEELHKGQDVVGPFDWYDGIQPAAIWQIVSDRNTGYYHACQSLRKKIIHREDLTPTVFETKLDQHGTGGLVLDPVVVEKFLLHGTRPEHVLSILNNGFNEHLSKSAVFGDGAYLAEDVEKIDQYVQMDAAWEESGQPLHGLHKYLYGSSTYHPGKCFYGFLCRAAMGCSVHTLDGKVRVDGSDSIWQNEGRELAVVPGSLPPEHFHSLVVELGISLLRFREFVLFHSQRALPEFLVAYQRTARGTVVPA